MLEHHLCYVDAFALGVDLTKRWLPFDSLGSLGVPAPQDPSRHVKQEPVKPFFKAKLGSPSGSGKACKSRARRESFSSFTKRTLLGQA